MTPESRSLTLRPAPGSELSAPAPVITSELRSLLRTVKLGQLLPTLPERLTLARATPDQMPPAGALPLRDDRGVPVPSAVAVG